MKYLIAVLVVLAFKIDIVAQIEAVGKHFSWVQEYYPNGQKEKSDEGNNLYTLESPNAILLFGMNQNNICTFASVAPKSIEVEIGLIEILNNSDDTIRKEHDDGTIYWQTLIGNVVVTTEFLENQGEYGLFVSVSFDLD